MSNSSDNVDVDAVIQKLLEVRQGKPGKLVQLTESEIKGLLLKSREIFMAQPVLLELEAPIKICGMKIKRGGNIPKYEYNRKKIP